MATDIVSSLFGTTPEMYQAAQRQQAQQQAMQMAQLDPFQRATAGLQMAGYDLGQGIGGALGVQDPMLQRISQQQALLKEINPSDQKSLALGIQKATDMGNTQLALALSTELQKLQKTGAEVYKSMKEAMPPEQKLAQALADNTAERGTPEWNKAYGFELKRLTTKEATDKSEIHSIGVAVGTQEPVYTYKTTASAAPQQIVFKTDAQGNQTIVPYTGGVDRTTAKTNVSANLPPQEKEEQGTRGKMLVEQYKDISKQAGVAARTLPALDTTLNLLDKGFDTGFGTQTIAAGARILASLGVKDAESLATNAQSFIGAASQAVLTRQLEQKGPQTEADAARITQTGAQLGNTKEANRFLVTVAKAQFKRDLAQRSFYDKWWKENKTYDGAEDAWFSGEGGQSLFDSPELKKYKAPISAVNSIPTRTPTGLTGNPLIDKYLPKQ